MNDNLLKISSEHIFDRRHLIKMSSGLALGSTFLSNSLLQAQDVCSQLGSSSSKLDSFIDSDNLLHFWVDGLHFNELSDIPSQANLSLYMNIKQTSDAFVERVIMTNSNLQTIGIQEFEQNDTMSQGHVPYVMFHNVRMKFDREYFIFYQVRVGSNVVLKKFKLLNAKRSLLNGNFLPERIRNDFSQNMGVDNRGLMTTPFQYYTDNGVNQHSARGLVKEIGSDDSFKIDVSMMHGDLSLTHYMRYFIIADPVGRILGVTRRYYNAADAAVRDIEVVNMTKSIWVGDDGGWAADSKYEDYVAKISDCPYIQVFTEDVNDALARSTIHLV